MEFQSVTSDFQRVLRMDAERVLAKFKNVKLQIEQVKIPMMARLLPEVEDTIASITEHLATSKRFPAGFGASLDNLEEQANRYLARIKRRQKRLAKFGGQPGSLAS